MRFAPYDNFLRQPRANAVEPRRMPNRAFLKGKNAPLCPTFHRLTPFFDRKRKKYTSPRLTKRQFCGYNIDMQTPVKQKRNYQKLMVEIIKREPKGSTLLLHSCCAPCSSACLERLKDTFKITVLYYNPNIDEDAEYQKRKAEQIRFLTETGWADFLDCDHDAQAFAEMAKGLENEPERGARCYRCYALRLSKTAQIAR